MTSDHSYRIQVLEQENDLLRERVRQLETDLGMATELPPLFGLTGNESRLLGILLTRETCTKEQLMNGLYSLRHDGEIPEIKIVDVFVCKLRKKLLPFDVAITTIWGRGYMLTVEMKERLQSYIASARIAA